VNDRTVARLDRPLPAGDAVGTQRPLKHRRGKIWEAPVAGEKIGSVARLQQGSRDKER